MSVSVVKLGGVVGAAVTLIGSSWFMFAHFATSADTENLSKENEKKVNELVEIRINQDTAETARARLTKELCLNGELTDIKRCAKVGVDPR